MLAPVHTTHVLEAEPVSATRSIWHSIAHHAARNTFTITCTVLDLHAGTLAPPSITAVVSCYMTSINTYSLSPPQDGTRLNLNPSDRKALVMGLALHDKGKATLAKGDHKAALEELLLAEEAFCLVNPELLTHVDNMAMLLLDIVW